MPYANNKGADQPAHPRSLISAFAVRCLDSMAPTVAISKISRLWLLVMWLSYIGGEGITELQPGDMLRKQRQCLDLENTEIIFSILGRG